MLTSPERKQEDVAPEDAEATEQFIKDAEDDKPQESDTKLADIRLCFGAYFLVLIAGKERRGSERLHAERKARPVFTVRNVPLLMVIWGALVYSFYSLVSIGLQGFISLLG